MATHASTSRVRSIVIGSLLLVVAVVGLLSLQYGPSGALDLLWSGLLGVLYVILPVVVLAVLLLGFFRFNAWRQ